MKPQPAPKVPGNTPAQKLSNALRMVLTVPKEAVVKEEARLRAIRDQQRPKKPARGSNG